MKRPDEHDLETSGVSNPVSFPAFIPTLNQRLQRGASREGAKHQVLGYTEPSDEGGLLYILFRTEKEGLK